MRRAVDRLNPYIVVLYYMLMMVLGVTIKHPIHLGIMLVMGIVMAMIVAGVKPTLRTLGYSLIFSMLIIVVNPLVSKEGMTKIWEVGNFYITKEAIVYGAILSLMFTTVFMWFVSFNVIMTGDKYIYVLGRFLPSFSLLISLVLRLIPSLNDDYREQRASIKSMGLYADNGCINRLKLDIHALKGVISRNIDNASIRADSMEARGYGIAHRSCYLRYRVRVSDILILIATIVLGAFVIYGHIKGYSFASCYPIVNMEFSGTYSIVSIVITLAFSSIMVVAEIEEAIVWKRYQSRI